MKRKEYSNGEITIVWKPDLCIHSGICFGGLPSVFKPGERPWITPERATTENIVVQVEKCPSGALSYFYKIKEEAVKPQEQEANQIAESDLGPGHTKDSKETAIPLNQETKIEVKPNGPLRVHGTTAVHLPNGEVQIKETACSFCRCGHSKNKPYCDGSHREVGFQG